MCFSATASFTASGVILLIGLISLNEARTKAFRFLAVIPLLFATQQSIEGILWIVLVSGRYMVWKQVLTQLFLLFAYVVWPIYIPVTMRLLETKPKRKRIHGYLIVLGSLVSGSLLYSMGFQHVEAVINDFHIDYTYNYHSGYSWITNSIYLMPTVGSLMLSSVPKMWIMGTFNLLTYLYTKIFFFGYVVSVWCFFGALISTIVLWIIMNERRKAEIRSL